MPAWFDFEQDVIDTTIDQWHDYLRSCVRTGGTHFEHFEMNVHLYDSPEDFYETFNVIWCT